MKCALAALGFVNEDLQHNKQVIIDTMIACAGKADIVIFGEAFLQGFYGLNFDVTHDGSIAVPVEHCIIAEIRSIARQHEIAVSFGFNEKVNDIFYSAQLTIDSEGNIIDLYRRVSPGWKELFADDHYREGQDFHLFPFMGKQVTVALCGDLWFDTNIAMIKKLNPDVVFWPVYTDYTANHWNQEMKHEYSLQANKACSTVLYVNSYCKDKQGDEIAKGGAALFCKGHIMSEIASGSEGILFVEV